MSDSGDPAEARLSKRAKGKVGQTQGALGESSHESGSGKKRKTSISSLLPPRLEDRVIGGHASNILGSVKRTHTELGTSCGQSQQATSSNYPEPSMSSDASSILIDPVTTVSSTCSFEKPTSSIQEGENPASVSTFPQGLFPACSTQMPKQSTSSKATILQQITSKSTPILDQITMKTGSVCLNDLKKSEIVALDPDRVIPIDSSLFFVNTVREDDGDEDEGHYPESTDPPTPPLNLPSDESTSNKEHEDAPLPLYEGSEMSGNDCMVAILTYALTNHLSGSSTCELIGLLEILLPQPNTLPKSAHLFKKYFKDSEAELELFYYCTSCWKSRESFQDRCTDCTDPKRQVGYFISCPLGPQLQKLYKREGFKEKLNYKYSRKKTNAANIEDIYDGSVYKDAEKEFLRNPNNISLTWYTDGISIFECSTYSVWPCIYIVNELPAEDRYKAENVLVGGFWGGDTKPHPNIFLLPMYHEVKRLKEDGVKVRPHNSETDIDVRGIVIIGTCDIPAKSLFMNMKGHAGYFSCSKCLISGEKSKNTGMVMVFPHADTFELRNDQNYEECVQKGVKSKDGFKGVYGPSLLSYMFSGSFIAGMSCDVMHSVYMGSLKQILRLLFDTKYKNEPFSLCEKLSKANDRVRNINLPHYMQRLLLEFDVKLCYWKASLGRNFFLYIMLPVFRGILPDAYFDNLCMLVEGVSLLNSASISMSDLDRADKLLSQFCKDFQRLYGVRHMSLNIHYLRHLAQCVLETGNLFHTNCFRLEGLNGEYAALAHGTRHAISQITSLLGMLSDLPLLIDGLSSEVVKNYCKKLTRRSCNYTIKEKICDNVFTVGNFSDASIYSSRINELLSALYPEPAQPAHFRCFDRLSKNRVLYVSASYGRGSRVSCYCQYKCLDRVYHGQILTFVKSPLLGKFFALIQRSQDLPTGLLKYVEFSATNDEDLISVQDLMNVSISLPIEGQLLVIDPLNALEME